MDSNKLCPGTGGKTVLLFGCQCLSFDANDFRRLRAIVLDSTEYDWVLDVLAELPVYYRTATGYHAQLKEIPGETQLRDLHRWFLTGDVSDDVFPIPYVQLAPLLMITHFSQYTQYLQLSHPEYRKSGILHSASSSVVDIAGFCIGFLSALVVAASRTRDDLHDHASVALRLAMLMGAIGDAHEKEEQYTSLAVAWKEPCLGDLLASVLEAFPRAYITVRYDDNRVTVMAPRGSVSKLEDQLHTAGFSATQVAFNGRYHWSGNYSLLPGLSEMCARDRSLQTRHLAEPEFLTSNHTADPNHALHELVLRSILCEQCQWSTQFASVYKKSLTDTSSIVVEFGPERCIPPTFMRSLRGRVIHFEDLNLDILSRLSPLRQTPGVYDNDIAVVGMACRVAGADDLEEFWQILCSGASQHRRLPAERSANFENPWRPEALRPWWGNFLRDVDAFDHKFFKKVPREAMAQDPQQRLLLQVAYQALEQAGYFQRANPESNVGCYVACCTVDYEHNVNCHKASAYVATGVLRSFMAGKISHYFGWRGPAFCVDSACSGSAVAIHQACQALLRGECAAALVGGSNAILSPVNYDNLAGASFVSPTGPCKPFDRNADGYCRGEGVAAVYLKRMSDALADGDPILGTIAATAVEQNSNCSPIVVPDGPSLAGLFSRVTTSARVRPCDITVVEAHGTGTQAGDPAEYAGVRQALGGPQRASSLSLGSVKGLVGHTEGVSGLVALVKVLLMVHEGKIPPQPNFHALNPHIKVSPDDNIRIWTSLEQWEAKYRAVVINNYGASGSNASMVITESPSSCASSGQSPIHSPGHPLPFQICGLTQERVRDYCERLLKFLRGKALSAGHTASLGNLSFNICRQSNPALDKQALFSCRSQDELCNHLAAVAGGNQSRIVDVKKPMRPVVLCFGGQVSTFIGLDRATYDGIPLLRRHLDECHSILGAMGYTGLYPGIFEAKPMSDQVSLQTTLFSLQYACARAWIDSGVVVSAVVGHSFGELTALCVAGSVSVSDALLLVARRASIIRDRWGTDSGAMMAVEGEQGDVEDLLQRSTKENAADVLPATVACVNGPRSFTIAGSTASIDAIKQTAANYAQFSHLRLKRLSVTNAFHSTLVDSLIPELQDVTDGLTIKQPTIHVEHATEHSTTACISSGFVAQHLRQPVYFHHAIQRLAQKYPSCIWLEAGSNSTVTVMAARALGTQAGHHFQPVNITSSTGIRNLTETALSLWQEGLRVSFWGHHPCQSPEYAPVLLPPYQFEKSRHWLDNKPVPVSAANAAISTAAPSPTETMISLLEYEGEHPQLVKFSIDTSHPRYQSAVRGHLVAQTAPVVPVSTILDTVLEALFSIPDGKGLIPQVTNVTSEAPHCLDPSRQLFIELRRDSPKSRIWDMKYLTQVRHKGPKSTLIHCQARISLYNPADTDFTNEWAQYSRLVSHARCKQILHALDADDILQGRNVYSTFAEIVDYSERFQGVRRLVGKGTESAGRVVKKYTGESWADPYLCDCFSQVGGFWVNCMTDRSPSDIYVANGIQRWMRTPKYADAATARPDAWDVYATHQRHADHYMTDVFAFDSETGELVEVFLGLMFARVAKTTFRAILSRFAPAGAGGTTSHGGWEGSKKVALESSGGAVDVATTISKTKKKRKGAKASADLTTRVKAIVADFCAMDPKEITDNGNMADAGIDSLMAMELAKELEEKLSCTLPATDLLEADTFRDLVAAVRAALGGVEDDDVNANDGTAETITRNSSQAEDIAPTPLSESNTSALTDIEALSLPHELVLEAFGETKALTDRFLADNQCSGRVHAFAPVQTQLCVALVLEAFEDLGCCIRTAAAGERLQRVPFDPQHSPLIDYLYNRLEEARLIDLDGSEAIRTAISAPKKPSSTILAEISQNFPEYSGASQLAFFTGSRLASVLRGEQDGLQLIFGTKEGQELVSWMYGNEPHNVAGSKQILDFITRLADKLNPSPSCSSSSISTGPLRILEMGAGTGGATKWLLPGLTNLLLPVEYTFTDISPAFLALARRRFAEYPFVQYRAHDIEKPPADVLLGTQHIVIAINAVHATSNLQESTRNMRRLLRPDGVLLLLEMTQPQFAVDIVFGLFRGWWVFNDGRSHAITGEARWEADLHAAEYGHVDWTDGDSPEASVERVIFATAEGVQGERLPLGRSPLEEGDVVVPVVDNAARQRVMEEYVRRSVAGFTAPTARASQGGRDRDRVTTTCVLVTGATGSLGSHIAAHLARLTSVERVFCLNRRSKDDPTERQKSAFDRRGIVLDDTVRTKVTIYEGNTADALLGLTELEYGRLVASVTHIIHNAWPMHGGCNISSFEPQFKVMRNLVDLARDVASSRLAEAKVGFQFVSSISVVGSSPLVPGETEVAETRTTVETVLPNGYSEAKYVCERMLDETLHRYPDRFETMVVRPGQITGSSTGGYWNTSEHLAALIKSSQTLKVIPDFQGLLSWTPVDYAAAACVELLFSGCQPYPVYHIDNPVRQSWSDMIPVLAEAFDIPRKNIIPFAQWVLRVRAFPGSREDNPAAPMADWLRENFERMSCGELILATAHSTAHSPTLANVGPVDANVVRKYLHGWKDMGFLN
ncbi:hypothetical protein FE257_000080 [Aspergillus nanangensis]|uniref:Carrier domain-containing protein n=1 Tax=Aspergillus nanangensis TaxID=2582783 RepID=A0AAD4CZ72_ASPNN|nr:hypothetical protein FE257_000080 [Aspergillus nanangensis]